ncbi:uncharacterized protein [Rutidosis leptorrhynchoides]|uniref:uncharacterized protein n=1 Tax=Rutidosis leptorrhynchoides TaxID=125765 RepID=UPI003A992B79
MKALSSFRFELKVMSAKNIQVIDSKGYLFVRCYLPTGDNRRVPLESKKISPNSNVSWNESFSFDCLGTKQPMDMIFDETIVFELRWKTSTTSTNPLFTKIIGVNRNDGGSKVLGRAEVALRSIFESRNMESERWVVMRSKKGIVKAPSIHLGMKIQVMHPVVLTKVVRKLKNKWDERCGCSHGHCCENSCIDSEIVAIGFALDGF